MKLGYEYHLRGIPSGLGHSGPMEMGIIHHGWLWWWTEWPLFCVSCLTYKICHFFQLLTRLNRWAHEICTADNEERAIVTATMNEMAYVLQAWLPLIVWQQVDAPRYHKGYITVSFISALLIATAFVTRYLHNREIRQRWANLFAGFNA